jgi:hypothetical protein
MAGNTSSSASARSMGYVSSNTADNTTVNVYVDSSTSIGDTSTTKPAAVNYEVSPGITTSIKKSYKYVPTVPNASGKFFFDSVTPSLSTKTGTSVQKIGSAIKLTKGNGVISPSIKYGDVAKYIPRFDKKTSVNVDNKFNAKVPVAPANPGDYEWNLPPHKWSMPRFANDDPNQMPSENRKPQSDDRYRRGRIWWKASDTSLSTVDGNGKTTKIDNSDRKYGFQFLWNPTSFGTAVAVQMDATPNVNDRFLGQVGAFPATESISFTIEVNRINDFAHANAVFKRPTNIGGALGNGSSNNFITPTDVAPFVPYYSNNGSFTASLLRNGRKTTVEKKLVDLFQRGTLADIEYLYTAINGRGPGSTASGGDSWKNGRGIITADIGFLMPTLLNIDIGPLSYLGYVTNMSVNHTMFTQDMIPIQSTVQVSFNLLATAGLASTQSGSIDSNGYLTDDYHGPR